MSNSAFIVLPVLMTIVSPIFHAKIVGSIDCGVAEIIVKPCLRGDAGDMPTSDCCAALVSVDRQAIGVVQKQDLCLCYQSAIKFYPYN